MRNIVMLILTTNISSRRGLTPLPSNSMLEEEAKVHIVPKRYLFYESFRMSWFFLLNYTILQHVVLRGCMITVLVDSKLPVFSQSKII